MRLLRTVYEGFPVFLARVARGRPDHVFRFDGGIGDELLSSTVAHELKRRNAGKIWFLADYPELFRHNPDIAAVIRKNRGGARRLLKRWDLQPQALSYAKHVGGRDIPPPRHIVTALCESAGITGQISRRPYLFLDSSEKAAGRLAVKQIAIQSSGLSAKYAALTKEWFPKRFQEIVDRYRAQYTIIQIGSAKDPILHGAIDLRGKTTIRESAAILASSCLFIGLVGFLQHLARSVECRSVIVYGGRELPSQSAYSCNENVSNQPPCSPCWLYGMCEHNIRCMDAIGVDRVAAAIDRQLARYGQPLFVDTEECQPGAQAQPTSAVPEAS